jgi:hypothetical protein
MVTQTPGETPILSFLMGFLVGGWWNQLPIDIQIRSRDWLPPQQARNSLSQSVETVESNRSFVSFTRTYIDAAMGN